jgi:RND family efflux transporter MFP subunit
VDNQVTPQTGTMHFRGVFANKDESLTPGFFARVRVPIGPPHSVLLVSDRAIDNDQGQKIVYIVKENNEVVSRPVRLGALHGGLRAIEDGLNPGDRVIVNGLQRVRPGATVEPRLVVMPTGRQRDKETGRQGVKETGSQGLSRPSD